MVAESRSSFYWMLLGVFISVALITFVEVQMRINKTESSSIEAIQNMAPQINYFFIPFFFLPVAIFAGISNVVMLKVKSMKLVGAKSICIGMCYGLILSFFIFLHLDFSLGLSLMLSAMLTFLSVYLLTDILGESAL